MIYALNDVAQVYAGRCVLRVPSLMIEQGEVFALVGPSGAGKSTLLRLLALLEKPSQGNLQLCIEGKTHNAVSATIDVRRQLAMVFQRPALLSRSVWHNVAYGLRLRGERDIHHRVDEVLEQVDLTALAHAQPDTLSGGELQRVSIARAIVLRPRVLLLDEPTANLDPYNVQVIETLVQNYQARYAMTVIVVTHNLFQARRLASRVGLMYGGNLVEVADKQTFFTTPRNPHTRAFVNGDLIY